MTLYKFALGAIENDQKFVDLKVHYYLATIPQFSRTMFLLTSRRKKNLSLSLRACRCDEPASLRPLFLSHHLLRPPLLVLSLSQGPQIDLGLLRSFMIISPQFGILNIIMPAESPVYHSLLRSPY